MCRRKNWARTVSHPSNAFGILEMVTNWALLVHSFFLLGVWKCQTWNGRQGVVHLPPFMLNLSHYFLSLQETAQGSKTVHNVLLCCCFESGGDRRWKRDRSQMHEKPKCLWCKKEGAACMGRIHLNMNGSLMFLLKLLWKDVTWVHFAFYPLCLRGCGNLPVSTQVSRDSSEGSCSFEGRSWWGEEKEHRGSLAMSSDRFRFCSTFSKQSES